MNAIAESYNRVPYPRSAYHYTHPDRLRVLALLLGLDAPAAENCRVLELGCASGGNLIPLAYTLPRSTFVGLDVSARQIDEGRQFATALGLKNIALELRDVCELAGDFAPFDYILAHGFYSWVPPEVSDAALAAIGRLLSLRGVAYVSYNTFPTGHVRTMIRRMAQYHVRELTDPAEMAQQVRSLVRFLSESTPFRAQAYGTLLRDQLHVLERMSDAGLLHEVLEVHNHPALFSDFVARAESHGLRYLAEATLADRPQLSPAALAQLNRIRDARGSIDYEQYLDFFNGQSFRRTLLCRKEIQLDGQAHLEKFEQFLIAASTVPIGPVGGLQEGKPVELETLYHQRMTARSPISKAAWITLGEAYPRAMHFAELAQAVGNRLGKTLSSPELQTLTGELVGQFVFGKEVVEFYLQPPQVASQPGDYPKGSAVARYQLEQGWPLTSLTHKMVQLKNDASRELLKLLDGGRSLAELSQQGEIAGALAELTRFALVEQSPT